MIKYQVSKFYYHDLLWCRLFDSIEEADEVCSECALVDGQFLVLSEWNSGDYSIKDLKIFTIEGIILVD